MTHLDLFKGKTSLVDPQPVLKDGEQILAYLEQLLRLRSLVQLRLSSDDEIAYESLIEKVNEEARTFTLSLQHRPAQEPKPGTPVFLWFTLGGLRFRTTARFLQRCGYMQSDFQLPESIQHAERRGPSRAGFSAREKAQVTILEGLGEGVGVSGLLYNLSLGGMGLRVDRAIDLQKDRRIPVRGDLLAPMTSLRLVRLHELPHAPLFETSGRVRHLTLRGNGLFLGLSFESLGGLERQVIERILSQKGLGLALGFPRKRRRGELEPAEADQEWEESPPLEEPDAEPSAGDLPDAIPFPDRRARLKKCSRQILLVMGNDLDRKAMLGSLQHEGYRCIYEARGLIQALDLARRCTIDLVIIQQQVGPHPALDILERLRLVGRLGQAKVVVLKETEDWHLTVAVNAGVVSLVVPQPLDLEGVLLPGIQALLEVPSCTSP